MPTIPVTDRLRVLRDWWRSYDAVVWDRWLAAVFTGLAFVPELATVSAQFGDLPRRPADGFALVLVLGQTVPLAVRRRWPAACLAVVGVSFIVHESIGYRPEFGTVTVYIALYSAGAFQERFRRGLAVAASAAYLLFAVVLKGLGSPERTADFAVFYASLAACWLLGAYVRRRRAEEATRRRLAAAVATAGERARIARELHDVVTHHVTAIVVQADAAQFLTGSPERVTGTLTAIGGSGRRALSELRSLLGVLEATGEATGEAAGGPSVTRAPVTGTLRELVEQTRLSGQPVELIEEGEPEALRAEVSLTVYRVAQEGLTNAVKYAAGQPTVVRADYRGGQVSVEVTNAVARVPVHEGARRDLSGGRGLAGLRERVGLLGGEVTAGEQPDGRFRMRAVIPAAGES